MLHAATPAFHPLRTFGFAIVLFRAADDGDEMLRFVFLGTIMALSACNRPSSNDMTPQTKRAGPEFSIPFERAVGFRDGYLLRVPREGQFVWNGITVDAVTLGDWIPQYAQAGGPGRLWVEFEPGVPPSRKAWVRKRIIDSGLCAQRRCVETDWNAQWSVVN